MALCLAKLSLTIGSGAKTVACRGKLLVLVNLGVLLSGLNAVNSYQPNIHQHCNKLSVFRPWRRLITFLVQKPL